MGWWVCRLAAAVVLAGTLLAPSASHASMALVGTGEGSVDGQLVSAFAKFLVTEDGKLQIILKHTGTGTSYAEAHTLSDVTFNMPDADFHFRLEDGDRTGSSVVVRPGSTLYLNRNDDGTRDGGFDVGSEWALARGTALVGMAGEFDYSVTATTFDKSPPDETKFAEGNLDDGPETIDGPDFGLINTESNVDGSPFRNFGIIVDSVLITLSATRALTEDDLLFIRDISFSYGSEHTGMPAEVRMTPEPASLLVWCLIGLTWAAVSRTRRFWSRRRHGQA